MPSEVCSRLQRGIMRVGSMRGGNAAGTLLGLLMVSTKQSGFQLGYMT